MPDPEFRSLSSSQVPDLLNISPWGTRYTLFNQFRSRVFEDRKETVRMRIGKLFEALILELTAERLALEVRHNAGSAYYRHAELPLGCTADATVLCPTRGFGIVEAKAIDKYEFLRNWTEKNGPKYYEAQLQEQMMVPHPEHGTPAWGLLACFIYNEGTDGKLELYERRPIQSAQQRIAKEASTFFDDLAAGRMPSPFGLPVELAICNELYPEVEDEKTIDEPGNYEMAELARLYAWTADQARSFSKAEADMKPKLVDFMRDAGLAQLGGGVRVKIRKPTVAGQFVMLPAELRQRLRVCANALTGMGQLTAVGAITEAVEWAHIVKNPGVQNRIVVTEGEEAQMHEEERLTTLDAG